MGTWKRAKTVLGLVVVLGLAGGRAAAAFPDYVNQNSSTTNYHSGICTSDGKVVWDSPFAWMTNNPTALTYEEIAFAFMECYGGGMFDELEAIHGGGGVLSSFTSAARHNELSWAGVRDAASGGRLESYYNLHYSPVAGGATAQDQRAAAQNGYNNDLVGPVVNNPSGGNPIENPQYLYTYLLLDRISPTLHGPNLNGVTPDTYRAIVFGGSVNVWSNFYSTDRILSDLLARGYTNNEIYLMYPSAVRPNGTALPANWVRDDGTTYRDMLDAWTWMKNQSTATTQVYFWSSHSHGSRTYDVVGAIWDDLNELIQLSKTYSFDLSVEFVTQVTDLWTFFDEAESIEGKPYWQVVSPVNVADLAVVLNTRSLPLLEVLDLTDDGTEWLYKFGLEAPDIAALEPTGNTFEFTWTGDPVDWTMAGLTTGERTNEIPEPATLCLLGLGLAAVIVRRRRGAQ